MHGARLECVLERPQASFLVAESQCDQRGRVRRHVAFPRAVRPDRGQHLQRRVASLRLNERLCEVVPADPEVRREHGRLAPERERGLHVAGVSAVCRRAGAAAGASGRDTTGSSARCRRSRISSIADGGERRRALLLRDDRRPDPVRVRAAGWRAGTAFRPRQPADRAGRRGARRPADQPGEGHVLRRRGHAGRASAVCDRGGRANAGTTSPGSPGANAGALRPPRCVTPRTVRFGEAT